MATGVQEAGGPGGHVAAVVRYAAGYGHEGDSGSGELAHAAVDEVGHGNGDRDVAVSAVHNGARQAHHRGDMALRWERHEDDGALRDLGSHAARRAVVVGLLPSVCGFSQQRAGFIDVYEAVDNWSLYISHF